MQLRLLGNFNDILAFISFTDATQAINTHILDFHQFAQSFMTTSIRCNAVQMICATMKTFCLQEQLNRLNYKQYVRNTCFEMNDESLNK